MLTFSFTRHHNTPDTLSATWLLPIVTSVVCAASGGVVSHSLIPFSTSLARSTMLVSYIIWGTGVPLALMIITLFIYRMAIYGIPSPGALPTLFLPLGPCGQGSYGILMLGKVARALAYLDTPVSIARGPEVGMPPSIASTQIIGEAIYAGGLVTSLILWGLALCFYVLATTITIDHSLRHSIYFSPAKFSIGWTAYTFPIGVFATATTSLAAELDSQALRVIGTVLSLQVVGNWAYVMIMTSWGVWGGTVFVASELETEEARRVTRRWGKARGDQDQDQSEGIV
jgi:tellurite resistance protein TehA-like permease